MYRHGSWSMIIRGHPSNPQVSSPATLTQGHRTREEVTVMAELMYSGNISEVS